MSEWGVNVASCSVTGDSPATIVASSNLTGLGFYFHCYKYDNEP